MKREEKIREALKLLKDFLESTENRILGVYISKTNKKTIPIKIQTLEWVLNDTIDKEDIK